MIFGTKHTLHNFNNISLAYDTDIVERVDNFKYLGVVFDPQLTWSNHIDQLTSNVSKRIGIIQRIKYYLPSSTLNLLGDALVMPLFDYCSSVWSNMSMSNILILFKFFIIGLPEYCSLLTVVLQLTI